MPKILLVTSGKGGTGKTTVSMLLAHALCRRDRNVLLIELDSGLRGLDLLLGVSDRVVYDLSDYLCGRCKPVKAVTVCDVPKGNLHLIAAPSDRYFVPDPNALASLLRGMSSCYDELILDTAAGLGRGFDVAASLCTSALVVTTPDPVSVRDAAKAVSMLQRTPPRLIVNKFSTRQLSADLPDLDSIIDTVGAQRISVIPEDPALPQAGARGVLPPASSPAMGEIEDLARRLLGERVLLNTGRLR